VAKLAIIFQITKFLPHFLRSCVAVVDFVEAAGARQSRCKHHFALTVAALQCCSSKISYTKVKN